MHRSPQLLLLLLVSVALCLCSAYAQLKLSRVNPNPKLFDDSELASGELSSDNRQLIPELGYVRILNISRMPKAVREIQISFDIFNSAKTTQAIKFQPGQFCSLGSNEKNKGPYPFNLDLMAQSHFNVNTRTIIMVSGYRSQPEEVWIIEAREQWLQLVPDADVIQVSWSDSSHIRYDKAVARTPIVARQITLFLHYLATLSGTSLSDDNFVSQIHLVGFSLGSHISAFVGQDLGGRVGRITGLDPAGPMFDQSKTDERLDPSDARLVDVLHTNSGTMKLLNLAMTVPLEALYRMPLIGSVGSSIGNSYSGEADTSWFGIDKQIGHLDFYVNNGRVQPGCKGLIHHCDHLRANEIYIELLKYEVKMRRELLNQFGNIRQLEWERILKLNRLHAFKAQSYDEFASGSAFVANCNELMKFADSEQRISGNEYTAAFNACSVPLDFVTPSNELVKELKLHRDIDINPGVVGNSKFYFRTLADEGFVGDHWVIKLDIEHNESDWDDSACSLVVGISMTTCGFKEIDLHTNKLKTVIERRQAIGLPFVHAHGPMSKVMLISLLKMAEDEGLAEREKSSPEFRNLTRRVMPEKITLSMVRPKADSFKHTVKDVALKLIRHNSASSICSLVINKVELQPISIGSDIMLTGVYRNKQDEFEQELVVTSDQAYKSDNHYLKQVIIGKLHPYSQMELNLQGLVVNGGNN